MLVIEKVKLEIDFYSKAVTNAFVFGAGTCRFAKAPAVDFAGGIDLHEKAIFWKDAAVLYAFDARKEQANWENGDRRGAGIREAIFAGSFCLHCVAGTDLKAQKKQRITPGG